MPNKQPAKKPFTGTKPPQVSPPRKLPENGYAKKTVPNPLRRAVFPFSNKEN